MISRHPGVFLLVGRWIGIGFACVKHCARGFTAAISRDDACINHSEARDGRTGENLSRINSPDGRTGRTGE